MTCLESFLETRKTVRISDAPEKVAIYSPYSDFIYPAVRAADNPGIKIVRHHTCLGESFKLPGSGWIEDLRHLEREESVM